MDNNDRRIALLIDADNVSSKYIKGIVDEISTYGTPTYKRIYADWTNPQMAPWKMVLLEHSITPIQQYSYTTGKNATDSAMIIDAMDILYSGQVDGFCIVSSDSDFTKLASRLREAGMFVLGMGEKKTPSPFKAACETFKYLEVLARPSGNNGKAQKPPVQNGKPEQTEDKAPAKEKKSPEPPPKEDAESELKTVIVKLDQIVDSIKQIVDADSDEDGWTFLSQIGIRLNRIYPDFDPRNYGYSKLHKLVEATKLFQIKVTLSSNGRKHYLIKNK